jgi:AcrR family transcriptional regulator
MMADDLTARARIRNAALHGFAEDGVAATSIRGVAKAAGVSPSLVQHHFPSKADLRAAVNEYVAAVAEAEFSNLPEPESPEAALEELGDHVVAFVDEHRDALLYVARGAIDGDPQAVELFDGFNAIAAAQWQRLADLGALHPDLDLDWAALHTTVINLGAVLMADAIGRHLPEPFGSPGGLERWKKATVAMFRRGLYR